jgi:diguanylate cyclase (GGDEF)-like protein
MRRPIAARAALAVSAYWVVLLAISLTSLQSALPFLIVAGLPVLIAAGIAIWKSGAVRVDDLAFLDDLTGLQNRRAFTRQAMSLIRKAKPGSASLVLIDVDGLKKINDDCGHLAGDELLEQVAQHLCRTNSTVYRVGGDEFAILVDRTNGESVTGLMRSLTPLSHIFRTCNHEHVIQFSYGFASRREDETFEQVFSRADARLRQFKHRLYSSGRLQDRRMTAVAAEVEFKRVLAEAEADEHLDESTVVSIFSRIRRPDVGDVRSGTGSD